MGANRWQRPIETPALSDGHKLRDLGFLILSPRLPLAREVIGIEPRWFILSPARRSAVFHRRVDNLTTHTATYKHLTVNQTS